MDKERKRESCDDNEEKNISCCSESKTEYIYAEISRQVTAISVTETAVRAVG
jgi:hypothetical protein